MSMPWITYLVLFRPVQRRTHAMLHLSFISMQEQCKVSVLHRHSFHSTIYLLSFCYVFFFLQNEELRLLELNDIRRLANENVKVSFQLSYRIVLLYMG